LEWAAGMRTHSLVSLGSALFIAVSIFGFSDILAERHVILDPSRVAAQVASGIGFIGAGTIILRREIVKGLTTAASIWAVGLALVILVLAKPVKTRLFPNHKARFVTLVVDQNTSLAQLRSEIEATNLHLDRIVVRPGPTQEQDNAELV
jgi:putative Mg2+ transporter-C (MgtC) family protein